MAQAPSTPPKPAPDPLKPSSKTALSGTQDGPVAPPPRPKVKPLAGELIPRPGEHEEVAFNFANAKLYDVIQQIARMAGMNYTIDPAVKDGPVRLFMNGKLERNSIEDVLALALKLNGVAMVRNGDFLEFSPAPSGSSKAGTPLVYGTQPVDDAGESMVVTQVIPLQFLDAEGFSGFAKEFMSQEGRIALDKGRNLLVAVDYMQNLRRVLNFVDLLDKQPFDQKRLALFRLKHASPERLLKELEPILKAANVPVGSGALQILPLQSLNALLVVTQNQEWIPDIKGWIDRFDEKPRTEEGELYVLSLKHAKADALYPILSQVLRLQGGQAPARSTAALLANPTMPAARSFGQSAVGSFAPSPFQGTGGAAATPPLAAVPSPVAPGTSTAASAVAAGVASGPLSANATIMVDPDNNALVIFGTQRDYSLIESAVEKLDLLPRQVLIEATILDISMTGEFELGISGFLKEHFNPDEVNVNEVTDSKFKRDLRFDRPTSDSAFTLTGVLASRFGLLKAILSAKDSKKNTNVVSQPRLWALDNRPARLLVQDQIPIPVNTFIPGTGTGTGSSGYSVTNAQYLDTGLNLTVTPHINGSGVIRIELQQDISTSLGFETLGSGANAIQAPRISRRSLTTELIAPDGATIVLGGLIQQDKGDLTVGLPLINRIPILRHLFSSRRRVNSKSELVILLTPKIVAAPEDLDRVTRELKQRVQKVLERNQSWYDSLLPVNPKPPKLPE